MFMYVLLVGRKVDVCINEVCPQSEYEYCAPNLLETYTLLYGNYPLCGAVYHKTPWCK